MTESRALLSVPEFCRSHGIARSHFYQLLKEGRGPRIIKLGRRTLISIEAAAAWRRALEAGSAPSPARRDRIEPPARPRRTAAG
jgi:predicted DNA-binding transcriptional regulator AlpA